MRVWTLTSACPPGWCLHHRLIRLPQRPSLLCLTATDISKHTHTHTERPVPRCVCNGAQAGSKSFDWASSGAYKDDPINITARLTLAHSLHAPFSEVTLSTRKGVGVCVCSALHYWTAPVSCTFQILPNQFTSQYATYFVKIHLITILKEMACLKCTVSIT